MANLEVLMHSDSEVGERTLDCKGDKPLCIYLNRAPRRNRNPFFSAFEALHYSIMIANSFDGWREGSPPAMSTWPSRSSDSRL